MNENNVLLVGVNLNSNEDFDHSMMELKSLAEACNMQVTGIVIQNLQAVHQSLYIGSGKVEEVKEAAKLSEAETVVFDNALSPTQLRNLSRELELEVLDRTSLILEIFSDRAKTREAKMQVESARLQYMLPRLAGMRTSLGRQGGGSGRLSNKGAGEKKIELDRRRIESRISELRRELEEITKERDTQRRQRIRSGVPRVALVGYTNSGKSTLMNAMIESYVKDDAKTVLEKDMLFATLDTTVRKITPKNHKPFLLSDTVGFIDKLPHNLIKAFRSTLEEAKYADLLLEVIDFSDEHFKEHIRVTEETLKEIGAAEIPVMYVYNKAEKVMDPETLPKISNGNIYLSAKGRIGLEELITEMEKILYRDYILCKMLIPYQEGSVLANLQETAEIRETEYLENGVRIVVNCHRAQYDKYENFRIEQTGEKSDGDRDSQS